MKVVLLYFTVFFSMGAHAFFDLYLSPNGSDANSGKSQALALKTLARAHAILKESSPEENVRILIAPGNYGTQSVVWTYYHSNYNVMIRAIDLSRKPVFDGCTSKPCQGKTWFILNADDGQLTNIQIFNLKIRNYLTAISFQGNRDFDSKFNGGNRVRGCEFENIGSQFVSSKSGSTAVIRLVNSRNNSIEFNKFKNIDNHGTTLDGLLHAVYIAHLSHRNLFVSNNIVNATGIPIKVRDFSNSNLISENLFSDISASSVFDEWYCDSRLNPDCTKNTFECPSQGNILSNNRMRSSKSSWYQIRGDGSRPGCKPLTEPRLKTSRNRKI